MLTRVPWVCFCLVSLLFSIAPPLHAQQHITTPKEQFGHNIGDDYFLANYADMIQYWKKLAHESDRISLLDIGKTSEGRTMEMAVITSSQNQKRLSRYREIAQRLARADNLTESQAKALAAEGKAVVWIDGGIHADEVLGAQQLIEMVFELASRTDSETTRALNNVIVLACIVNPDGMDLVSDWYMREPDPIRRSLDNLPRLYQKYSGHDDNRDFYMSALMESRDINQVLYRQWFPQIVYDHHQTGPAGTVMFSPPFRDPFNFNYDPLVMTELEEVGAALHSRFAAENKPGVTSRSSANYSTWWNGGLRTSPYFHNMIGVLTETIGNPTPMQIPFAPSRQLPTGDLPYPIAPQPWHFQQSIEYEMTANRAVLDYAARNKDRLLFNIYRMGRDSIERGSEDSWTASPKALAEMTASIGRLQDRPNIPGGLGSATVPASYYQQLHTAERRDPRGYVIPSDRADFLTATKFINTLFWNGVTVMRARARFSVNGKSYPAGSYVVKTNQSFRPHILDTFEAQDYPDDFAYPGASPTPPYDNAGWTLAYQMGIHFDRLLDAFDGPFDRITTELAPPAGSVSAVDRPAGYLFTHEENDSFIAVNRLLDGGESVYWLTQGVTVAGKAWPAGTQYVQAGTSTLAKLQQLSREVGLNFQAVSRPPASEAMQLRPVRIGVWDQYGGSIPAGWMRFVLDEFQFPYTVVYSPAFDAGNLSDKFDVLILADDAVAETKTAINRKAMPQLRQFLNDGGTILAIGGATDLGYYANLPIADALAGAGTKFYIPGSIVDAHVDRTNPIAYGLGERVDFVFDQSPVFRIQVNNRQRGIQPIAWFDTDKPLRSGWALGQAYLKDAVAVLEASIGKGKMILYGPQILFRGQPHGTFKLLFNGIYAGHAQTVKLGQ